MMKAFLSATAMTLLIAGGAAAQQSSSDPARTPAARSDTRTDTRPPASAAATQQQPGQVDAEKLIGTDIENPEGQDIGEVKSVMLGSDGKVDSVIVGVGGFLGLGEREVALKWNDLQVMDNGKRVVANYSKDQLKTMPEFKYTENQRRGGVFTRGETRTDRTAATTTSAAPLAVTKGGTDRTATSPVERDRSVTAAADNAMRRDADRPAHNDAANGLGQLSADKIIGQNVVNARGDNIGEIEDLVLDNNQKVFAVVSVGGFLGMGDKDVAVPFDDLRLGDNRMIMMSEASEEQLKQLPAYKKDSYEKWNKEGPVGAR